MEKSPLLCFRINFIELYNTSHFIIHLFNIRYSTSPTRPAKRFRGAYFWKYGVTVQYSSQSVNQSNYMVIIVMGVLGCGKTTMGKLLAERLGLPFYDADDFHPVENVEKMRSGEPLTDADRHPWLAVLSWKIEKCIVYIWFY